MEHSSKINSIYTDTVVPKFQRETRSGKGKLCAVRGPDTSLVMRIARFLPTLGC